MRTFVALASLKYIGTPEEGSIIVGTFIAILLLGAFSEDVRAMF